MQLYAKKFAKLPKKHAKVYFQVRFCCKCAALSDRTFEVGALEGTAASLNARAQPALLTVANFSSRCRTRWSSTG